MDGTMSIGVQSQYMVHDIDDKMEIAQKASVQSRGDLDLLSRISSLL